MQAEDDRITLRGMDPQLWRQLRVAAIQQGLPVGKLLNTIVAEWLAAHPSPANAAS